MSNMKDFILNELEISKDIREKIDLIKQSNMDFNNFNNFKFVLKELDNFDVNFKLSNETINKNINNFVNKLINNLDSIIEKIPKQNVEKKFNNDFLNMLAEIDKYVNQMSSQIGITPKETKNLRQQLEETLNNPSNYNLKEKQIILLQKATEALKKQEELNKENKEIELEKSVIIDENFIEESKSKNKFKR